jgi:glycosyltransferase involved in cell wall biosynthesis
VNKLVSVIIPNYNGAMTIDKCLAAVLSSDYPEYEVIVVDDGSTDRSVEIIEGFPCKLVKLDRRSGASRARNAGAGSSSGEILFFMDSDCLVRQDTVSKAVETIKGKSKLVAGGTYTWEPVDDHFFSFFQSIFIHYSETRNSEPDYIASHAMVIERSLFESSGGFPEDFLPILEDVEFSHRLRRQGCALAMNPDILVRHIFNFTLIKSLRNAFRKAMFWTIYSMGNKDLMSDSGTASRELKINGACLLASAVFVPLFLVSGEKVFFFMLFLTAFFNIFLSRGLVKAFYRTKGISFACAATIYYMTLYPLAAGAGALSGVLGYRGHSLKK